MAENKKSFLLYADTIHILGHLTIEQRGLLLTHILEYVNDKNPTMNDPMVSLAFEPIKLQLKRDLKKYENIKERNRQNGAKGGRPKTQNNPKNPDKPKKADNDTVNVNVKDNVTLKESEKEKLIDTHGFDGYQWIINKLSAYKLAHGKKYKSDYGAINSWVVKEWEKERKKIVTTLSANEKLDKALGL